MAAETKRQNKVPVALPRNESEASPAMIPRDAILRAVIGARIRVTTSGPEPSTVEGTIFTSDPVTNFLVLHISPPMTTLKEAPNSIQPGTYRFLQISTITSFQLLSLPTPLPDPSSLQLNPSTLDMAALKQRLNTTVSRLSKAESQRGPLGTTPYAQALFDALARLHPMSWATSTGAMIFSDEYIIEKPYGVENIRPVSGGAGNAAGYDRVRKVVKFEKDKIDLKWSAKEIEGKMGSVGPTGKENRPAAAPVSPRKGG